MRWKYVVGFILAAGTLVYAAIITVLVARIEPINGQKDDSSNNEVTSIIIKDAIAQGNRLDIAYEEKRYMRIDDRFVTRTSSAVQQCTAPTVFEPVTGNLEKIIGSAYSELVGLRPFKIFKTRNGADTGVALIYKTGVNDYAFMYDSRGYKALVGKLPRNLVSPSTKRERVETILRIFLGDMNATYMRLVPFTDMPAILECVCTMNSEERSKIVAAAINMAGGDEARTQRAFVLYESSTPPDQILEGSRKLLVEILALPLQKCAATKRFMLRALDQQIFSTLSDDDKRRFVLYAQTCVSVEDFEYLQRIVRESEGLEVSAAYFLLKGLLNEPYELTLIPGALDYAAIKRECAAMKKPEPPRKD